MQLHISQKRYLNRKDKSGTVSKILHDNLAEIIARGPVVSFENLVSLFLELLPMELYSTK